MRDTTPQITQKMNEMFQQKTPLERIKIGCSMYETSKSLLIRSILESSPNISAKSLQVELFLRFYGDEFDEATRAKIVKHLQNCTRVS